MSENLKNKIDILFKKFNSGKTSEAFKDIEILVEKNNTNCELITSYAIMANKLNLVIDYDEQLAITSPVNFALLIHGTQGKEQTQLQQQQLSLLNMSKVS